MKIKHSNRKLVVACLVVSYAISINSWADRNSSSQVPSEILISEDGTLSVRGAEIWAGWNSEGCDRGTYLVVPSTSPIYSELFAAIMSAYTKTFQIRARIDGCAIDYFGLEGPAVTKLRLE